MSKRSGSCHTRVAVGGAYDEEDAGASRDLAAVEDDRLGGHTSHVLHRRLEAEHLLDGPRQQAGVGADRLPLVRVCLRQYERFASRAAVVELPASNRRKHIPISSSSLRGDSAGRPATRRPRRSSDGRRRLWARCSPK